MKTHWRKLHNPDYLGAYALDPGKDMILTIKSAANEMVIGADGKKEECMVMRFVEPGVKPMIVNATNAKTISKIYKTPYIEEWAGKKIQIFSDNVKAFGEVVEALRIRPFEPKPAAGNNDVQCTDCGDSIQSVGGKPPATIAKYTADKYGRPLCGKCAEKAAFAADPLAATDTVPEGVELL